MPACRFRASWIKFSQIEFISEICEIYGPRKSLAIQYYVLLYTPKKPPLPKNIVQIHNPAVL